MADGLNRATLLGNLGADPELRYTGNSTAVLNLRLATTESWFDKEAQKQQERTEWHAIVVWGKLGEALAKFLAKGDLLYVEGSLRTESYEDKEGVTRYTTKVHATFVRACGGKRDDGAKSAQGSGSGGRGGRDAKGRGAA